jgi:hypothetical protein
MTRTETDTLSKKDSTIMAHRLGILAFVGSEATLITNGYKVNPANPSGPALVSQMRREYKGENTSAAVRAFALKVIGASAEHSVAREVEPGLYSIELPEAGDAPVKAPKGK